MGWALIGIFIFCTIQNLATFVHHEYQHTQTSRKRILTQTIVEKQQKQVNQIINQKQYYQSYHFQLDTNTRSAEFYLDTQVNDQLKAQVKVLWKHQNAFILPSTLKSQRVEMKVYQDQRLVETQRFYTKAGFKGDAREDSLYKIVVSHKRSAKISKLVTLNVEHYFESFQSTKPVESRKHKRKNRSKSKKMDKNEVLQDLPKIKKQDDSQDEDSSSQESSSSEKIPNKAFELSQLQERVQLLLNETKLLINEAETKHLAQFTIQKYIEESIEVYWSYQIVECGIVLVCVVVQILLIHKLFNYNKIVQLI